MKQTLFILSFWLLALLVLVPIDARAQTAGGAFSCDGTFYQTRQSGSGATAFSVLYRVDRSNPAQFTTNPITGGTFGTTGTLNAGAGNIVVNGLAYNSQDGYLYALTYPADNGTARAIPHLYKIGLSGVQDLGVTNLPIASFVSGTFDKNGNYYLINYDNNRNLLYRLQVTSATPLTATSVPLQTAAGAANVNIFDIAYNPVDNNIYGVANANVLQKLVLDSPTTPTKATVTTLALGTAGTENIGTSFFDISGRLYAYSNGTLGTALSGKFYTVDTQTGAYTQLSTIDPVSNSDGASCINPLQRIDAVKEVTNVVAVNATTFDISYTIRIRNTGTVTDNNVQVSELLRGNANNTTFPTATSVAISGLTVTNPDGSALVVNTGFTGVSGGASLLTGNQGLTAGQRAVISFTARVVFPAGGVPSAAQNNSAYATSTSVGPNNGYSQATNGTLLPPNDLTANDASTNGAILPPLRADTNDPGDTPSPTPITFAPSISGIVFEDVNYSGGAGRDQGASSGSGRNGAVVELYTVTAGVATYSANTSTDASGNYTFIGLTAGANYVVRVVNSTVTSSRPGYVAGLLPVQTFRTQVTAAGGTILDPNRVGGEDPTRTDAAAGMTGTTLAALNVISVPGVSVGTIAESQIPVAFSATSSPVVNVNFGYNFDLVVNTNDAGQSSLRQFIINSNALLNTGLDQVAFNGTVATGVAATDPAAGVENAVFMMNDGRTTGTAPAGLTLNMTAPAGYSTITKQFIITLASGLPNVTDNSTAIDGLLQTALTGNNVLAGTETTTGPEVVIDFSTQPGLLVTGTATRIASVGLNNAKGSTFQGGAGLTFLKSGTTSADGSIATDITTFGNNRAGVRVEGGVTNITVSSNVLNGNTGITSLGADGLELLGATNTLVTGNTISGNKGYGIFMTNTINAGVTISNNIIRNNGKNTAASTYAGISIGLQTDNNSFVGNTITGNAGDGIVALAGTQGNRFSQNNTSNNGDLGIDLSASATVTGDGVSLNADGKTTTSGANLLLNFPVFTQATINAGRLFVSGYVKAGATVEIFVASADPTNFGEGATYSFSATEGSTSDTDPRLASYNGTSGSETGVSRFIFSFPVDAAQIASFVANKLTATATVPATVNGVAVGNTSEFSAAIAVINNKPLPVELTDFTVTAVNKVDAALLWHTATEKNNDHFDVERSFNGADFVKIGQVKGQGNKTTATEYALTDAGIGFKANGPMYYRLKQVDTDGAATYSPVRTMAFTAVPALALAIALFPNPATTGTQLDLTQLPIGRYQVSIIDATGRIVLNTTLEVGLAHALDLNTIASGTYNVLVRGQNNGQTINLTKRLIKE